MDIVVACQIARVVHGELLPEEVLVQLDTSGFEKFVDVLRRMNHVEVPTKIGVLILDRVEAVRTLSHDPLELVTVQGLDVHLCEREVQILVAKTPGGFAGALFFHAEDAEFHIRFLHDLHKRSRGLLVAIVKGAGAAHPVLQFLLRKMLLLRVG